MANMQAVDFNIMFETLNKFEIKNNFWWLRGDKESMLLSEQVYITTQAYMKTHLKYFGCCE